MHLFPIADNDPLPSPSQLKAELPASERHLRTVTQARQTIARILDRSDSRLLMIVGPCSIHDNIAAREYASKLKKLAVELSETFFIVMRVYFEKPRTTTGWKGMLYDPFLDGSHDIKTGLTLTRQLLLELADMGVPTGAEFLDPNAAHYVSDLISWGCVGARTVSSQIHRQMAAGLAMPIGFKNNTDGNIDVAVNAMQASKSAQTFLGLNDQGKIASIRVSGNSHTHLVLRGGENEPNYDPASIDKALQALAKANLPLRVMIDCSHDNSSKNHELQPSVFQSVIRQVAEGNTCIAGIALESHLNAGSQQIPNDRSCLKYGVSLTDPCLDWNSTEYLLRWSHAALADSKEAFDDTLIQTHS